MQSIKTIKYNNFTLDEFFDEIYKGLHHLFDKDLIIPKTVKAKDLTENTKYDREANIIFNRSHALFDIFEDDKKIDMTENENFMNYFFDESIQIPEEKQIFLRRLLMGLTSHFPIGKTAVTDMPQIVEAEVLPIYKDYTISENINVVPCVMSSIQWLQYSITYNKDKLKSIRRIQTRFI